MTREYIPSVGIEVPTSMDGYLTPHPQAFTWTCPHCEFGPTDLEGAHRHLNVVHYRAAETVLAETPAPSSDSCLGQPSIGEQR